MGGVANLQSLSVFLLSQSALPAAQPEWVCSPSLCFGFLLFSVEGRAGEGMTGYLPPLWAVNFTDKTIAGRCNTFREYTRPSMLRMRVECRQWRSEERSRRKPLDKTMNLGGKGKADEVVVGIADTWW